MGRVLAIIFFVVMTGYALSLFVNYRQHITIEAPIQDVLALAAAETASGYFSQVGTLVFYPNNVGPIPYIFYLDQNGRTKAKALVLPYESAVDGSWTGGRVFITGSLVKEHVVVSSISYLAAP